MKISVFMVVLNEEKKLGRTLDSLKWADEIIVVDGGSTDKTIEICKLKGVKLFFRPFDNFENQKNHALSLTTNEWVLSIDADEVVTQALAEEIQKKTDSPKAAVGYFLKRKNYFLGSPLRFSGQRNEKILRFFRKESGKFVGLVHESVRIKGNVSILKNWLEHYGTENLSEYFEKLRLYTSLEANRLVQENRVPSYPEAVLKPPVKWVINYIFLGGFLDGRAGFLYHGLSCYYGWTKNFTALKHAK